MTKSSINLAEFKEAKNTQEQIAELAKMIDSLNNCIDELKPFAKYINIMESLSILHNSRTLFEIKLDKVKNEKN